MGGFILWLFTTLLYLAVWYVVKLYKEDKVGEFFTMMCISMLPFVYTLAAKALVG